MTATRQAHLRAASAGLDTEVIAQAGTFNAAERRALAAELLRWVAQLEASANILDRQAVKAGLVVLPDAPGLELARLN